MDKNLHVETISERETGKKLLIDYLLFISFRDEKWYWPKDSRNWEFNTLPLETAFEEDPSLFGGYQQTLRRDSLPDCAFGVSIKPPAKRTDSLDITFQDLAGGPEVLIASLSGKDKILNRLQPLSGRITTLEMVQSNLRSPKTNIATEKHEILGDGK